MIHVRFYGELKKYNEGKEYFILERKKYLEIKDIIFIKKIPLKKIGLIILNGESVYPDFEIKDNDYISIYPEFKNLDISGIKILNLSGLIDTHSHLDEYKDLNKVLFSAKDFGVEKIIALSTDYESSKRLIEMSNKSLPLKIFMSMGVHPNNLNTDIENGINIIEDNIKKIVGIGECGLDYKYERFSKELQKEVFSRQILLAEKYKKPIIIHSRGAWEDCFNMLKNTSIERVNFHWFSGGLDILKKILDKGYFISATPALKYSLPHREVVKYAPLEQILIETDSPVRHFKMESEPKDIIITIKYLSDIKKEPLDKVIEITRKNAEEFFNI